MNNLGKNVLQFWNKKIEQILDVTTKKEWKHNDLSQGKL